MRRDVSINTIHPIRTDQPSALMLARQQWVAYHRTLMAVFLRRLMTGVIAAAGWLAAKLAKRRSRRCLRELTDDELRDIGVSRGNAKKEAERPFWD